MPHPILSGALTLSGKRDQKYRTPNAHFGEPATATARTKWGVKWGLKRLIYNNLCKHNALLVISGGGSGIRTREER